MDTMTLKQLLTRLQLPTHIVEAETMERALDAIQITVHIHTHGEEKAVGGAGFPPYDISNRPEPGHVVRVTESGNYAKVGAIGTVKERSTVPWIHFIEPTGYAAGVPHLGIPPNYADCLSMDKLQRVA